MPNGSSGWWSQLLKFWPMVGTLAIALAAAYGASLKAEFSINRLEEKVGQLQANRDSEIRQWQKIADHDSKLDVHEVKINHLMTEVERNGQQIDRLRNSQ